jgi:large exoprotein involved in heme utilization and adhesion
VAPTGAIAIGGEVAVSGAPSGTVHVVGESLTVRDGGQLLAVNQGDTAGGNVAITTGDRVAVSGGRFDPELGEVQPSRISSQTTAAGAAGDVTIATRSLIVDDGIISAASFGAGAGGDLTVNAREQIRLSAGPADGFPRGLVNAAASTGDAGDVAIATGDLTVENGALIISGTRAQGNGGTLTVQARSVTVQGTSPGGEIPSTIQSSATDGPDIVRDRFGASAVTGRAGDAQIQADRVQVLGGGAIAADTDGPGAGGRLRLDVGDLTLAGAAPTGSISRLQSQTRSSGPSGGLEIQADNVTLLGPAYVSTATFGAGQGGDLTVQARSGVFLSGTGVATLEQGIIAGSLAGQLQLTDLAGGIFTGTAGSGTAGNLTVTAPQLQMQEGAVLFTPAFASGDGGNIRLDIAGPIEVAGAFIGTGTTQGTTANAGRIAIATNSLLIRDGGLALTSTLGNGNSGAIRVQARDRVELRNTPAGALVGTGIFANTLFGSGAASDITIEARELIISGGAVVGNQSGANIAQGVVSVGGPGGDVTVRVRDRVVAQGVSPDGQYSSGIFTDTLTTAPAGNLRLDTARLEVLNGAGISSSTVGSGRGGSLSLRATESVTVAGTGAVGQFRSNVLASSGRPELAEIVATGNGGDLRLDTPHLRVRDGAIVSVNSSGSGNAGSAAIAARVIELTDGGSLSASTQAGLGGNLTLSADRLVMRRGSAIATNAGNSDGGNIQITTDTLTALENSDITANANQGRGGRVQIAARAILGTEFRDRLTPESDITATSDLGAEFSGTVDITRPEVDPDSGLLELPEEVADPVGLVATRCAADEGSQFVVVGRGGLPPTPDRPAGTAVYWQDWRSPGAALTPETAQSPELDPAPNLPLVSSPAANPTLSTIPLALPTLPTAAPLIEAAAWQRQANGQVALVAAPGDRGLLPPTDNCPTVIEAATAWGPARP